MYTLLVGTHLDEEVATGDRRSCRAHLRTVVVVIMHLRCSARTGRMTRHGYLQRVRCDGLTVGMHMCGGNGIGTVLVGTEDEGIGDG